ncbi:hypothetical protein AwWohl_12190 [Gammaproteobacteria bacterium]|nr:hypothetical protein AwWohl_12190 [Gammaproteobacteria bacterium]
MTISSTVFNKNKRINEYLTQSQAHTQTHKIALMGMSGVGKTALSKLLPRDTWFHYSIDYRIGTRYLNEEVSDFLKLEAMKNPLLAQLLRTDSIRVSSNLSIENLAPLSAYLGMVGNVQKNGLELTVFLERLAKHRRAEIAATQDVASFIEKVKMLYGYPNFLADTSGSLCELDDQSTLKVLASSCLLVYIKSTKSMQQALINRALSHPKPLYYQKEFLLKAIADYCLQESIDDARYIDPALFAIWVFPHLVKHRLALYQAIADQYGITVSATDTALIKNEQDFVDFITQQARAHLKELL